MANTLQEQAAVSMEFFAQQQESRAKELLASLREAGFSLALRDDGKNLSIKPGGLGVSEKRHLKNMKTELLALLKWEADEAAWGSCKGEYGGKAAYEELEAWFKGITNPETVKGQAWGQSWIKRGREPARVVELFSIYLRAFRDSALAVDDGRKILDDWKKGALHFKKSVVGLHFSDPPPPPEVWELMPDDMIESADLHRSRDALCSGLAPVEAAGDAFEPEEDRP